jgi:RND family efflux transporter MFP subunit
MDAAEQDRVSPRRSSGWAWPSLRLRVPLPFPVLAVGFVGAWLVATSRPPPDRTTRLEPIPLVAVAEVHPEELPVVLRSQGTVVAGAEIDVVAEVSGPVLNVSAELEAGGRFEEGTLLIALDPTKLEIALRQATAVVTLTGIERRKTETDRERLRALVERGVTSAARLEEADFAAEIARAREEEARARRGEVRRQLSLTAIRAPFTGRVRAAHVHAGQFVERGQRLARIYPTDDVEVRLPLVEADLVLLGPSAREAGVVWLRGNAGGAWEARIVRVEGHLDERSRMTHVRARLLATDAPPPIGAFLHAEIQGPVLSGMTPIARSALTDDGVVLLVNDDQRLEARAVDVARVDGDQVWIRSGLAAGDRVALSSAFLVPGEHVQARDIKKPSEQAP